MAHIQWVRLDSDLPTNKKIIHLVSLPRGREALGVYCCALAWTGANETDGHIPAGALPFIHGKPAHVRALIDAGLFQANGTGWVIPNWDERQPTRQTLSGKRTAAGKGNCIRWHGPDCGCWKDPK